MSADRFTQTPKANDSGSWNKYSYTRGDPVNRRDRNGTCDTDLTSLDFDTGSGDDTGCDDNSGGGGSICSSLGLVDAGNGQCVEPAGPGAGNGTDPLDLDPETGGSGKGKNVLKWLPKAQQKLTKFKTKAGSNCDNDLAAINLTSASIDKLAATVRASVEFDERGRVCHFLHLQR